MSNENLITAILAFAGGTGFSALLKYLLRNKQTNITTEAVLRQELTDRLDVLSSEIEDLKVEVAFWRDKYLELYKAHADLRAHLGIINNDSIEGTSF